MLRADSNNKQSRALAVQALLDGQPVRQLLGVLSFGNEEARVVGGAVRDTVMGRAIGDVDIATTVLPETVIHLAQAKGWKAVPTGIEHGTVTLVIDGISYEITTLRRDVETDGRRAVVAFSRDFKEDAFRRDFTMNAMSLSQDGTIHDYATGVTDANDGIVRFMGDPATRIREDYLRILRFFRFQSSHGRHDRDINQNTADFRACAVHMAGLMQLSRERIRQEILKLLDGPNSMAAVRAMESIGIWDSVMPNIDKDFTALQHLVVLEKTTNLKPDITVRVAALCGPTINSKKLQEYLALSNREHKRIVTAEKLAREINGEAIADNILRKIVFLGGRDGCTDALLLKNARIFAGSEATIHAFARAQKVFAVPPVNPFSSQDVTLRGIRPGVLMGRILKKSLELWLDSGLPSDASVQKLILDSAIELIRHNRAH